MEIDSPITKILMGFLLFRQFLIRPILRRIVRIFKWFGRNLFLFTTIFFFYLWRLDETGLFEQEEAYQAYLLTHVAMIFGYTVSYYQILLIFFLLIIISTIMWQIKTFSISIFRDVFHLFCKVTLAWTYFYLRIRNKCTGNFITVPEELSRIEVFFLAVLGVVSVIGICGAFYLVETIDYSTFCNIYVENITGIIPL